MQTSPKIQISASLCILLAISLLLLPLQWFFAAIIAACIHETCHLLAIRLVRGKLDFVSLGIHGAAITVDDLSLPKECFCALAGPAGGLFLLLFARWIPRIAICAAIQSLYNLLPLYPLDGGRALRCVSMMISPKWGEKVCVLIENICLIGICAIAVYACLRLKLGLFPVVFAAALWYKTKNTPCKESLLRLQ